MSQRHSNRCVVFCDTFINGVKVTDIDCISSFCTSSSSGQRPRRSDAVTCPTSTASTTGSNWPATTDREGTCSGTRCTTRTPPNPAPAAALRTTACVSGKHFMKPKPSCKKYFTFDIKLPSTSQSLKSTFEPKISVCEIHMKIGIKRPMVRKKIQCESQCHNFGEHLTSPDNFTASLTG